MVARIDALTRFPIKSLSGEELNSVKLLSGQGFPGDRQFGFARPNSGFDPENPKPLPKSRFYVLARNAKLASLKSEYNDATGVLSISTPDKTVSFEINTSAGKIDASLYIQSFLLLPEDELPQLFEASPHRFTDVSVVSTEMMNAVSIINLDSVREFSNTIGKSVDPRRFRGNIHLANFPPFSELKMIGQQLSVGTAKLKIVKRTKRCPATEVDLFSAERNLKTQKLLLENYGHMDMGVYAEVVKSGVISKGDMVEVN